MISSSFFLSSDVLVGVRYVNLRNANYYLFIWIFLTVGLSILDLGLGIAFGIDYDTLRVSISKWKNSAIFMLTCEKLIVIFISLSMKAWGSQCSGRWYGKHWSSTIFDCCGSNSIRIDDECGAAWLHHLADKHCIVHIFFYANIQNIRLQSNQSGHFESRVCVTGQYNASEKNCPTKWSIQRKVCGICDSTII